MPYFKAGLHLALKEGPQLLLAKVKNAARQDWYISSIRISASLSDLILWPTCTTLTYNPNRVKAKVKSNAKNHDQTVQRLIRPLQEGEGLFSFQRLVVSFSFRLLKVFPQEWLTWLRNIVKCFDNKYCTMLWLIGLHHVLFPYVGHIVAQYLLTFDCIMLPEESHCTL